MGSQFQFVTHRFGTLEFSKEDLIEFPQGLLGFPDHRMYVLVDPGDSSFILWMQSVQEAHLAFPVLELSLVSRDSVFKPSTEDLNAIQAVVGESVHTFLVLTIPQEVSQMTANLRAPLLINGAKGVAIQAISSDMTLSLKHPIFSELRQHYVTMASQVAQKQQALSPERPGVYRLF